MNHIQNPGSYGVLCMICFFMILGLLGLSVEGQQELIKHRYNSSITEYEVHSSDVIKNDLKSLQNIEALLKEIVAQKYKNSGYVYITTDIFIREDTYIIRITYLKVNYFGFQTREHQDFIFTKEGKLLKNIHY